jgi:oxygen-independent coproporphyrinogen-3 oxidase
MAGIYIHFPFCKKKCIYCNFFSSASAGLRKEMCRAVSDELILRKNYLNQAVETIYFGGGTPSLMENDEILRLCDTIFKHYQVVSGAEITLEVNPDDISSEKVSRLKQTPVNRISVGVQSFSDKALQWLGRIHSAAQAVYTVKMLQDAGYENLSPDLIFGIPGINNELWLSDLNTAAGLMVPHLSVYALTIEPGTIMNQWIEKEKISAPGEDQTAEQFLISITFLEKLGYIQYEISNYAKPGFESRHNSNYWNAVPYLGAGPSAHSFNIVSRQWNCSSISGYLNAVQKKHIPFEMETLDKNQQFNEYVMTSLRTSTGLNLRYVEQNFGAAFRKHLENNVNPYILQDKLKTDGEVLKLSNRGKLFADQISGSLFMI